MKSQGPPDDQSSPKYLEKMLPLRGKILRLRRPELLLAKNFFSSLAPPAPAEGEDKEPGHIRTRHSDVELVVVVVVVGACRGWLGWSPGRATA